MIGMASPQRNEGVGYRKSAASYTEEQNLEQSLL
jgi:hypothetical protein